MHVRKDPVVRVVTLIVEAEVDDPVEKLFREEGGLTSETLGRIAIDTHLGRVDADHSDRRVKDDALAAHPDGVPVGHPVHTPVERLSAGGRARAEKGAIERPDARIVEIDLPLVCVAGHGIVGGRYSVRWRWTCVQLSHRSRASVEERAGTDECGIPAERRSHVASLAKACDPESRCR